MSWLRQKTADKLRKVDLRMAEAAIGVLAHCGMSVLTLYRDEITERLDGRIGTTMAIEQDRLHLAYVNAEIWRRRGREM